MLESGQQLAHFKIIKKLGAGGMGEVYLAEDTNLKRKVALKLLLSEYFEDKERKERFQREARTAAQISHPNVMSIFDIGTAPEPGTGREMNYIVMEYVDGLSLSQYIAQNGCEMGEIIFLAEHIAAGLAAAHKINVVHRDIKMSNILVDDSNQPKILDFGLAKPVAPVQMEGDSETTDTISQELTKAGKIVGTVSYMSPEQIKGEPVDSRCDIFAFGILLYRMATGDSPFESDTNVSTMAKILESQPESPRIKNNQVPPELERIIRKCLQKKPDDRYQDTRDLVVDLRNLRRQYDSGLSSDISALHGVQTVEIEKPKKSGPSIKAIIAYGVIGIIALVLLLDFFEGDGSKSKSSGLYADENALAILGFENKTGDSELDWLQTGLPEILQTDLAQSNALTIISRDRVVESIDGASKSGTGFQHEECIKAANNLGAKHALSGTFYKLGDKIRIDSRLEELSTGKIISTVKVVGSDPFVLVDSLTTKLATALGINADASSSDVAKITSSNPEAYKKYIEGLQVFNIGMYDASVDVFKEAIALDSTFALPYMRIGMARVFTGKNTEGAQWFAQAMQYADRLPIRERNLLDVYSDLWLSPNFDNAFTKMETLVKNYPDDAEMRTLYALMVSLFRQDSTAAYAHFDTVLQTSPRNLFCLAQYIDMRLKYEQYDLAEEAAEKLLKYYPQSPSPYALLSRIAFATKDMDRAIEMLEKQYEVYDRSSEPLFDIYEAYINKRDFEKAEIYAEKVLQKSPNDPFELGRYYNLKSALALWNGQFKQSLKFEFRALDQFLIIGDSNLVAGKYNSISNLYDRIGETDSSLYYADKGYEWSTLFSKLDYPFKLIDRDRTLIDTARVLLNHIIEEFKIRLPEEFWPMADGLLDAFEGEASGDTLAMIDAFMKVYNVNPQNNKGILRSNAYLQARIGQYDAAIKVLDNYRTDPTTSTSGYTTGMSLYYLGISYEGIGDTKKAIESYQKMLEFWGHPDIEIEAIADAKKRLANLTS
ncbi:MAG: protein kinase [Candidatus Zixiibacteriota bacterium]